MANTVQRVRGDDDPEFGVRSRLVNETEDWPLGDEERTVIDTAFGRGRLLARFQRTDEAQIG